MRSRFLMSLMLLAAPLLHGQVTILPIAPPFVPPDIELKAYLNLTDAQLNSLRQIQKNKEEATSAIYKQMSEKQMALNALLEAGSRDAAAVGQLMIDINTLRKQLPVSGPYRESALAVLTPDQKAKLPALSAALVQVTIAYQAVNFNLIESPPARILPAGKVEPALPNDAMPAPMPMPTPEVLQ